MEKKSSQDDVEKFRLELAEELIKDSPDQARVKTLARKCHISLPKNLTSQLGTTLLAISDAPTKNTPKNTAEQ